MTDETRQTASGLAWAALFDLAAVFLGVLAFALLRGLL